MLRNRSERVGLRGLLVIPQGIFRAWRAASTPRSMSRPRRPESTPAGCSSRGSHPMQRLSAPTSPPRRTYPPRPGSTRGDGTNEPRGTLVELVAHSLFRSRVTPGEEGGGKRMFRRGSVNLARGGGGGNRRRAARARRASGAADLSGERAKRASTDTESRSPTHQSKRQCACFGGGAAKSNPSSKSRRKERAP